MKLIILTALFVGTIAVPMYQSVAVKDDGSYSFSYETGKEGGSHSRTEVRGPDGVVIGKYSYEDPNGAIREISYRADDTGFVANGDVSVEGAPKGQFPVPVPETVDESPTLLESTVEEKEPRAEESETQETTETHDHHNHDHHDGNEHQEDHPHDHKEDEIHELPLEESTANEPPEAFPEGFFLQHFQGLRRLPEPTKEEPSSSPEPPTETSNSEAPAKEQSGEDQTGESVAESTTAPNEDLNKINRSPTSEMELFMHLRPFQGFQPPQSWSSSMFHQPVYVFSYQQPESFGYHYYY